MDTYEFSCVCVFFTYLRVVAVFVNLLFFSIIVVYKGLSVIIFVIVVG